MGLAEIDADDFRVAHGFLRRANGKFVSFDVTGAGTSQSTGTFPSRISDKGEIVGEFVRTPSSVTESFLYRRGVFSAVSPPNSRITQALGINDAGQIVGCLSITTARLMVSSRPAAPSSTSASQVP